MFFFNQRRLGSLIAGGWRLALSGLGLRFSFGLSKPSLSVLWDMFNYNIFTSKGLFSTAMVTTPFFTIRKRLALDEIYVLRNQAVDNLSLKLQRAGEVLNPGSCAQLKLDLVPVLQQSNFAGANELL